MSKQVKRNAIHSGIGDNDDLFVKRPQKEDITEDFEYAARLRGKKRHDTLIYPEIDFDYDISYKGDILVTDNEKEYEFNINAHPEKKMAYCITETKELPVKRLWEAQACFEAEVMRMNMKYAFNWKGKKSVQVRNEVDYAVNWRATVTSKAITDARSFFTSANGQFIGYGDATTWKKHSSGYVYDYSNVARFSGVIAKQYYNIENYEAEFDFKTVLATNDQYIGGKDDDVVGIIFKAKDTRNFYMMLWERHDRVKGSWRAPNNLEGFNMLTSGEDAWNDRVLAEGCDSSTSWSTAQMTNYSNNKGWKNQHRRIYKVTNGIMRRVNVSDLGGGNGWEFNTMQGIRVSSVGKNTEIYIRQSAGTWNKVFDFNADWAEGSFGAVNVSQAVQFHRIEVREKNIISGRIPDAPNWSHMEQAEKNLGTGYNYCINDAKAEANKLKISIPGVDATSISFVSITGQLKDSSKGSITSPISPSTNIIVKAGTHGEQRDITGRVPATGWFEFDGVGSYIHAQKGGEYIKSKDPKAAPDEITITSITGEVYDDPKVTWTKTGVVIASVGGQLIAKNNNPADVGKIYKKCYVRCGIVEVTPDNRDYNTGLLVFADIATVFKEDYDEFFNRPDYINKKATYELLKPVKKEAPKPPVKDESPAGCVIEEEPEEDEEEVIQCLNDFDFDGKKLVMWSCEFPIETLRLCFEDGVYAYQGWVTFDPLVNFNPNKWATYLLEPIEGTVDPLYDEIKWAGRSSYDMAPPGTKLLMKTTEWYRSIFPADIANKGIVTNQACIESELPPAPEHYWHPDHLDSEDVVWRMPDKYDNVHFLLDAWDNHPDVVMNWKSKPTPTTKETLLWDMPEGFAAAGRTGMPVLSKLYKLNTDMPEDPNPLPPSNPYPEQQEQLEIEEDMITDYINDRIIICCEPDPRHIPWSSGKYIGYGKVNGKRPFYGSKIVAGVPVSQSGKADMVNVPTQTVFFPENLVPETLQGPFITIHDKEFPDNPRVKYRLNEDKTLVDFFSDHTDSHIWYSDWYSKWVECPDTFRASMNSVTQVESPLTLDPTDSNVSEDYNPDDTIIERIEVTSSNPFVKLWIEEDKGDQSGLLGTYYRFPLTAEMYEESWNVKGDYKEWVQTYEVESYMEAIEIPLQHENATIIEVKIDGALVPKDNSNGWSFTSDTIFVKGTGVREGMLQIKYSTGGVENTFKLTKKVGTYVEVYVRGVLLDPVDYSIEGETLTIARSQLFLKDYVNIQSYEMNDLYDPTKREYLGERTHSQLDFQEDVPTQPTNPNYNDPFYEGSFCFNWLYKSPEKVTAAMLKEQEFKTMSMFLSETMAFKFKVDMEIVYPVGNPIDISNFTGEWKQWDEDPIKVFNTSGVHTDGPGDWHGPPEAGYPEVTNNINQSYRSGWYNPEHKDLTDYDFKFKVQARAGDDDMYGAIFKFNPETQSFYSFEWDAFHSLGSGGTGVRGMAIYKNVCQNPQSAGVARLTYTKTRLAHADISWEANQHIAHEIRISTIGNKIKVWTDDVLRFDIVDSNNPFIKGAWGPVTQSQPNTYFWDFWMQTLRRVTPNERPSFRKAYEMTKERPLIQTVPMIELELDQTTMQDTFKAVLNAYCNEVSIKETDILSIDYLVQEGKSDYSVYFKNASEANTTSTKVPASKLHTTVEGQYPPIGDPIEKIVPVPDEPMIPELEPPINPNPNDGFTVSWNGYIYAPESGIYKFKAMANDGFRLWVKGTEIISEWHITGNPEYFPEYEGSIYLEGGKWHSIRANYFDNVGQALIRLHWAQPGRGFQRISPDYLTPYLGYKLYAQVKQARPLPWHPLVHNGYYYHEEREHYLYAQKIVHKKTPDTFHEILIEPRPQQGSAIIVRDNEGNNLRKVTFYDESWNLTLENTETFNGNGYAKYYMNYRGIDKSTLKVKVNGVTLTNYNYLFNEEESSIEFMDRLHQVDTIEVKYKLLYSYYLDMNAVVEDGFVTRDAARIQLHSNYDREKMKDMEIIYESAKETPFYRATEVVFNPILNHNHTGFLYITEEEKQDVKDLAVTLSEKTLSNSGLEKVVLTTKAIDRYGNPCPNKLVKISRDGILISESKVTNDAGEVYLYDTPVPPESLVSTYTIECEGIMQEALLNYFIDNQPERFHLDVIAEKLSIMAGVNDVSSIKVTLRDKNWSTAGAGHTIKVTTRNTFGVTNTEQFTTDDYGQVTIHVSGQGEQHGSMMITMAYDMGFEETANSIRLKVIGG